ncbi:MAG TPA: ABC transporter ATP-binding protein [Polyangiaceae bacterium]|nr:ABC transporter ATP-binding protein [Polyangiaceae bacterium]
MNLEIEHLSKRYPNGVQALDDVSLSIAPGMFGLLGRNGAGKSTLMRILATLQEADSGRVRLGDVDVLREKERVRECLGYLPQEFGVYPKVTALDLLDHLARLKGLVDSRKRREVVTALLERTNLFEARHRRLGGFSGGMKQRFGIAQALIGNPKLIIVDEPTAGLDPEERARFHGLLAEIGEQVVVILSTHIVGDVSDLCQRMAILHAGRVLHVGDPLALTARLEGRLWQRLVDKADVGATAQGLSVVSTRRLAGRLLLRVHADQKPDAGFEPVAPDLEDFYFFAIKFDAASPVDARNAAVTAGGEGA